MRPTTHNLQLSRSADLTREPDAAGAHDAPIGKQRDLITDLSLVRLNVFRFVQTTVATTIVEAVVLKITLTSLVAGWAIEWVIQ